MALLGSESWDIYDTSNITDYWQATGSNSIQAGAGRCGSSALFVGGVIGPSGPHKGVSPGNFGGYIGFGFKYSGLVGAPISAVNITTAGGGPSIQTFVRSDGAIYGWAYGAPFGGHTLCVTPAGLLTMDRWYHLGFEWYSDFAPNGYFKIWVNGVLEASATGIDTRAEVGNIFNPNDRGPWGGFTLGSMQNNSAHYDDVYWGDTTGSAPWNAFLGDLRVEGQIALPDSGGAGTFRDFTPLTGTDHGAMVDDVTPDDDATYNEAGVVGATDTYKFPNITLAAGTVYGIQLMPNVMKTLAGARTIGNAVYQGGTLSIGSDKGISQTNYTYQGQMFQTNPTTSTGWTAATADSMEGGIKITS